MMDVVRDQRRIAALGPLDGWMDGLTGTAVPASHFAFSAATSMYPSGLRSRVKTLLWDEAQLDTIEAPRGKGS